MVVSHSKIETFHQCKYKYKLKYIDGLKTIFAPEANNALLIGTALHTGIEKNSDIAINEYYSKFAIITDSHIEEVIKLEEVIRKCKEMLPPKGLHEVKIEYDNFIGFIDYLVPTEVENEFDLYDFKYSNNIKNYMDSGQLHEYKYYYELSSGNKIRNIYFLFAPKVAIRMKKTENTFQFRKRLKNELSDKQPILLPIKYDYEKVKLFQQRISECENTQIFEKTPTKLCDWCEYQDYCIKGDTTMILPKNERRTNQNELFKKIWFYGLPFTGKTYLANKFKNVLMLNTDGNVKYIDAPCVPIKDEVTIEGRITKRKFAWEIFKETILELEKKENDFETIVVDLLEDTYEHCRLWAYSHLDIEHESDNSFKAYDYIRTEFLSTIKKLMNLDYNIILISHEDTSKDITKRSGDKITAIKPNVNDKVSLKIAGMVDIVGRIINNDGKRTISFKANEVIFGGGRLEIKELEIPCEYANLMEIYKLAPKREVNVEEPVEVNFNKTTDAQIRRVRRVEE